MPSRSTRPAASSTCIRSGWGPPTPPNRESPRSAWNRFSTGSWSAGRPAYEGTIRSLRVGNRGTSVSFVVQGIALVVEPPDAFPTGLVSSTPSVAPPRPVDLHLALLKVRVVDPRSVISSYPPGERGFPGVAVRVTSLDRRARTMTRFSDGSGDAIFRLKGGAYRISIERSGRPSNAFMVGLTTGTTRVVRIDGLTGRPLADRQASLESMSQFRIIAH